ncbi:MAG: rRNA maturation RNase YbeY [Clostridiaceae bacterium]|nr:rRNA maturation RNase YbeY [Clostridiaceae bacterium]
MILLDNRQSKININDDLVKSIEEVIDFALNSEKLVLDYEVSIIFVDNQKIREINNQFRNIDKETDVLSFPMLEYPEGKVYKDIYSCSKLEDSFFDEGKLVLGDIAISLEKALEQSKDFGHSFQRETAYLTVHSILHLLGYDHMVEAEKEIMRKREEEILNNFSLKR